MLDDDDARALQLRALLALGVLLVAVALRVVDLVRRDQVGLQVGLQVVHGKEDAGQVGGHGVWVIGRALLLWL